MTQKIHGDLEITGDLTVGGSAPGGGAELVLELESTGSPPNMVGTQSHPMMTGMKCGMSGYFNLSVVKDEGGIWSEANDEMTVTESGYYRFCIPPFHVGQLAYSEQPVNANGLAVMIKRSGSSDYIPYMLGGVSDVENVLGAPFIQKAHLDGVDATIELVAGDKVKIGYSIMSATNSIAAVTGGNKAHMGQMVNQTGKRNILVFKV